ncbi:uncharacterized protein LOC144637418 isoform X2 [Oculina patagonica]
MNIVFAVFLGWTVLLIGEASSLLNGRLNETGEEKGGKRSALITPRLLQLKDLVQDATGFSGTDLLGVYNYGCWCGPRGEGKIVDNFDYCCKAHDFCELDLQQDNDKYGLALDALDKTFKYNAATKQCSPVSEYRTRKVAEKKCRHAVCLCDMEMVRCMKHYKDSFNSDNIGWESLKQRSCAIPATSGDLVCKTKADVIILIQDSQGISTTTVGNVKTVLRRLLDLLGGESQDYNFALATYAKSRQISCFGSATDAISFMDREYQHGRRGTKNLLKRALKRMILDQFNKRREDRKGDDTAKILVMFSDGRAEHGNGNIMDTFRVEKEAKQLRDDSNVKIIGALIPNAQNTQRISELKGITSEPDDAIDVEFSAANLNDIADRLAARVKRLLICRVKYTVEIHTPDSFVSREYRMKVRIKGRGDQQTDEHTLAGPTTETRGNVHVIKFEFIDRDVGTIKRVQISPDRKFQGDRGWRLKEIKVKNGDQTFTAVFNEDIPTWPGGQWYSARATASSSSSDMTEA